MKRLPQSRETLGEQKRTLAQSPLGRTAALYVTGFCGVYASTITQLAQLRRTPTSDSAVVEHGAGVEVSARKRYRA